MALVRAVVGGKVAAAPINAIIDQVEETGRHIEFTATSPSSSASTVASPGTFVLDAATSNSTTFVTPGAGTITIVDAGIYAIDINGTIPVTPTGAFWIRLFDGTNYLSVLSSPGLGQIGGSLIASGWFPAGTTLTVQWWHVSAAARVLTSRLKVTRIA